MKTLVTAERNHPLHSRSRKWASSAMRASSRRASGRFFVDLDLLGDWEHLQDAIQFTPHKLEEPESESASQPGAALVESRFGAGAGWGHMGDGASSRSWWDFTTPRFDGQRMMVMVEGSRCGEQFVGEGILLLGCKRRAQVGAAHGFL